MNQDQQSRQKGECHIVQGSIDGCLVRQFINVFYRLMKFPYSIGILRRLKAIAVSFLERSIMVSCRFRFMYREEKRENSHCSASLG